MSKQKVGIGNICDIIVQLNAKRVLVVFESLGSEEVYEDRVKQIRHKHLPREESFLNYLTEFGVSREETDRDHLREDAKAVQKKGIDLAVVVGESAYQSVGLGAQLQNYGFKKPIFIEITKEDTSIQRNLDTLLANATRFDAIDLLHNLVYITKNRSPKYIPLDIPLQTTVKEENKATTTPRPKNVKRLVPMSFDVADPPERVRSEVFKIVRDVKKAQQLKARYDCKCQICGMRIGNEEGPFYIECHHIRPLGGHHNGADSTDNMLILSPNHHTMFDFSIPRFISPVEVQIRKDELKLITHHTISSEATDYHNRFIAAPESERSRTKTRCSKSRRSTRDARTRE